MANAPTELASLAFQSTMIQVTLIETFSGRTRTRSHSGGWTTGSEYYWSEGNNGCDCNRAAMFYDDSCTYYECGHTDYIVQSILADGRVVYQENERGAESYAVYVHDDGQEEFIGKASKP